MAPASLYIGLSWAVAILSLLVVGSTSGYSLQGDFSINTQDVIARKGHLLAMDCQPPHGFLPSNLTNITSHISWTKDGATVVLSTRVSLLTNGSLLFRRVVNSRKRGLTDEGVYECFAINSLGVILVSRTTLKVAYIAKQFTHQPKNIRVPVSSNAFFKCSIVSLPRAIYTWEHDGILVHNSGRYKSYASGVLEIVDVRRADIGNYRCVASNSAGGSPLKFSRLASLTLTAETSLPRQIFAGPQNQTIVAGGSSLLECHILGVPSASVSWIKEGKSVEGTKVGVSSLLLQNVRVGDGGVYTCQVDSDHSSQAITASALLTVTSQASLSEKPAATEANVQDRLELHCGVDGGTPQPRVMWLVNGVSVSKTGRVQVEDGHLVIDSVVLEDDGYYQCVIENDAGIITAYAVVTVTATFSVEPPTNLTATPIQDPGSISLRVSWLKSRTLGVVAYSVHYVPTEGGIDLQDVVQGEQTFCDIKHLRPHTSYTFYVVSYAGTYKSEPSQSVVIVTEDGVPDTPPEFDVISVSPSSIRVEWSPLARVRAKGEITHYKIYYRLHLADSWTTQTVWGEARNYMITSLKPATQYDVRILAGTSKGVPDDLSDSDWPYKTVATAAARTGYGPEAPTVQVVCKNSTAIVMSWHSPPDPTILGYKLFISRSGQPMSTPRILPPSNKNFTFFRLIPNTWYDIRVLAFNEQTGPVALEAVQTSSAGVTHNVGNCLAPPRDIHAIAMSDSSINVSWSLPVTSGIFNFTVRYKAVGGSSVAVNSSTGYTELQCNSLAKIIVGLQPYATYSVSVRSNQRNIVGPFSNEIQVRTLQGLPSAPEFKRAVVNGNRISLHWLPPKHPNGIIDYYRVLHKVDGKDGMNHWLYETVPGDKREHDIVNLMAGQTYYVAIKCSTEAGYGQLSSVQHLTIPPKDDNPDGDGDGDGGGDVSREIGITTPAMGHTGGSKLSDQTMGIIIGVSIGISCIIICVLVMVCLKRMNMCTPPPHDQYIIHNGNGFHGNSELAHIGRRLSHPGTEMSDFGSVVGRGYQRKELYHDAKGVNGRVNGKQHESHKNGYKNGKLPNGHHKNGGNGISHEHSKGVDAVLHDRTFTYMSLPRADMTFDTTQESTLDDIDRSFCGEESETESSANDQLLPQSILNSGPEGHGEPTTDTGILHNTVDGTHRAPDHPLPQQGRETEPAPPPCLSTFKPEQSGKHDTSNRTSSSGVNHRLDPTQGSFPPPQSSSLVATPLGGDSCIT